MSDVTPISGDDVTITVDTWDTTRGEWMTFEELYVEYPDPAPRGDEWTGWVLAEVELAKAEDDWSPGRYAYEATHDDTVLAAGEIEVAS